MANPTTISVVDSSNTVQTVSTLDNVINILLNSGVFNKRTGFSNTVTIVRPNNANVYNVNMVVGGVQTFQNMGPATGGETVITSTLFITNGVPLANEGSYTLYLYNTSPPSAYTDNVTWDMTANDRASYLGSLTLGTPANTGSSGVVATDQLAKQITLSSGNIYAYLVTSTSYTSTANRGYQIGLHDSII